MTAPRLIDAYDLVIFDLDGVVYLIDRPIPGAVESIARLRDGGVPRAYATNNASRRPGDVVATLTGMGIPVAEPEVFTSARAAAALLAARFGPGAPILVVGAEALRAEVREAGLKVVGSADESPVAVVQGYGPQVSWGDLAEGCIAVRAGALWMATNLDATLPTPRGHLPGNGALVAALATALDRRPDVVVGKPEPGLFTAAARRTGSARPLVVGDRIDTDIEGAVRAGMDSLLVLTGVSRPADLLAAPPSRRPTYVAGDLTGLFDVDPGSVAGWRVTRDGDGLRLDGEGPPVAALRALCAYPWSDGGWTGVQPGAEAAAAALRALGL